MIDSSAMTNLKCFLISILARNLRRIEEVEEAVSGLFLGHNTDLSTSFKKKRIKMRRSRQLVRLSIVQIRHVPSF